MVLTQPIMFNMYKDFQEATHLPMDVKVDSMDVRGDDRKKTAERFQWFHPAAKKQTAPQWFHSRQMSIALQGSAGRELILDGAAAPKLWTDSFLQQGERLQRLRTPGCKVKPAVFKDAKVKKNTLKVKIPAKSIVVLKIK